VRDRPPAALSIDHGDAADTESVEIGSAAARIWDVIATPERWSESYFETRLRSPDYPKPDSRNAHVYRTRIKADVAARVIHSHPPRLLEETQKGRTFSARRPCVWARWRRSLVH
jgi:hypothetical protein